MLNMLSAEIVEKTDKMENIEWNERRAALFRKGCITTAIGMTLSKSGESNIDWQVSRRRK